MANMMQTRRKLKNTIKNYSEAQKKVRDATSNDPWGPSSTLMSDIADATYNVMAFGEIMQMIWKRLNDHGKNWRHVYKSLVLLEYILKTGSEKVAQQCKENIFAVQTLKDFQYMEDNKDQGMNVREKAKQLVSLLRDDERLKNERAKALKAKERFAQNSMGISSRGGEQAGAMFGRGASSGSAPSLSSGAGGYSDPYGGATSEERRDASGRRLSADLEQARPSTAGEEELQLQLALAISKEEHDHAEQERRGDQVRLQLAVEESEKMVDPPQQSRRQAPQPTQQKKPTLVNLMDSAPAQPVQPPSEPWGISQPAAQSDPWAPQPSSQGINDPWGSGGAPKPDPWTHSSGQSTPLSTPGQPTDPWGPPAPTSTASNHSSPWSSPAMGTSTNHSQSATGFDAFAPQPANPIDDGFDMLSTRPGGSTTAGEAEYQSQNGQTSSSPNPFDMRGVGESLDDSRNQRKKPEDFLGANKNLVNLDNLVGRPQSVSPSAAMNPFMSVNPTPTSQPNPFVAQQQQQRVPLNQLQAQSTMGFTQPAQNLPNPLIPVGNRPQPMMSGQVQAQSGYNPFM
ncbi:epsin-2-like isoform X2 [Lineus longissimus]|uniref:epsin-2-like isoform X2 n=1 Tax=Lineus longissimus TaxID=88925 RepID=UPI00315D44E6